MFAAGRKPGFSFNYTVISLPVSQITLLGNNITRNTHSQKSFASLC